MPTRIFMVVLLLWLLAGALLPLVNIGLFLPVLSFVSLTDPATGDYQLISLRLQIVRAASFMTMAYFIFKYLRNRKPLSSVVPVLVFTNFLIFFSIIYTLRTGLIWSWEEWVAFTFLVILAPLLYKENRGEASKIFSRDW